MSSKSKPKEPLMSHDPLEDLDEGSAGGPSPPPDAVDLGDSLTIRDVAQTLERLRQAVDLGGTLRLDASNLEQVDAAGVQLLCAVVRGARGQDLEVRWDGASETLRRAAARLGLAGEVGL